MELLGLIPIIFLLASSLSAEGAGIRSTECGGVLDGIEGEISYKLGQGFDRFENCIWTIRTELKQTVQLQLTQDGFPYPFYNVISITEMNWDFLPETKLTLLKGDRNIYNVTGPLIYVQFSTRRDVVPTGTGFTLTFKGVGNNIRGPYANTNDTYIYRPIELNGALDGEIHYPVIPGTQYPRFERVTYTLAPAAGKHMALTILAPTQIGYRPGQNGYFHECSYGNNVVSVHEYGHWRGSSLRFTTCRSDLIHNTTITSPHPLVLSFNSGYTSNYGFGIKWENINL
jgi:hypothetical protein